MRITFSLNRWDLLRWNLHATIRQRPLQVLIVVVLAFMWWSSFTYEENQAYSLGYRIYLACFTVAFALVAIAAVTGILIVVIVVLRKHAGVLGEHTLEITSEGLRETTSVNETLQRWQGVHAVTRTRKHAYIYMNEGMAHVVPMVATRVQGDPEAFLATVKARRREAKSMTQPSGAEPAGESGRQ